MPVTKFADGWCIRW